MSIVDVRRPSFAFAKRHGLVVVAVEDGKAVVVCRRQVSPQSLAELRRFTGSGLRLQKVDDPEFERQLQITYEGNTESSQQMMDNLDEVLDLSEVMEGLEPEDLMETQDDAPIIRVINALMAEAIKEDASDIHVEPYESHLAIRFRVDGVLREVLRPQRAIAAQLVSRIKVMAKLDIAEKRVPQDGRISLRIAGRGVDVRVSTLPSAHGERVVMRVLDKQAGRLDLTHLGIHERSRDVFDRLIHKPHGIILVTGPTGSGKTTTLYAGLSRLNSRLRNIMTVEDPIEYYIDGISQTQVAAKVDMSFARGLRAILRQDPDVVMVGEIRDKETAEIAVQASLTGHLVLSTLHTNSAVGAVTRLRDMGIEPFLLSSSLLGLLAQRLTRKLCDHCKTPYAATERELNILGLGDVTDTVYLYEPKGCEVCSQTGFRGRTGIYELIEVTADMRGMIHDEKAESELEALARKDSKSILHDGFDKVLEGVTTLDEVLRVTREG